MTVSPYLNAAARRASIQCVTLRAPVASISYGHAPVTLEKSPPVESWGKAAIGGALIFAVFIPAVFFLMGVM